MLSISDLLKQQPTSFFLLPGPDEDPCRDGWPKGK